MTASLGASVLVILTFFAALSMMLMLAVHIESTLQPQRHRHRGRPGARVASHAHRVDTSAPSGSRRARSRM